MYRVKPISMATNYSGSDSANNVDSGELILVGNTNQANTANPRYIHIVSSDFVLPAIRAKVNMGSGFSGTGTLTVDSAVGTIANGLTVTGGGIPAGTTVASTNGSTTLTLSASGTAYALGNNTQLYFGDIVGTRKASFLLPQTSIAVFEKETTDKCYGTSDIFGNSQNPAGTIFTRVLRVRVN